MIDFNSVFSITKNFSILYVEDDKNFREETCDILYTLFGNVDIAVDGEEALADYQSYYEKHQKYYDMVISDISMPKMDGVELSKEIYKLNKKQLIIIISAHGESQYLLELINIGIEQFLTKPLDINNILTIFYNASQKILESNEEKVDTNIVDLNEEFYWHKKDSLLYCKDSLVKLSKKEILLMILLIKNRDRITTFEEIFNALWEDESYRVTASTLKPIIFNLRKKLPTQKIQSVSKVGYRLNF